MAETASLPPIGVAPTVAAVRDAPESSRPWAAGEMPEAVKVPRRPLAWGMQVWGPLPRSTSTFLAWDGPGSGLYISAGDPRDAGTAPGRPVLHPAANSIYQRVQDADAAVQAFAAAGIATWPGDDPAVRPPRRPETTPAAVARQPGEGRRRPR